MVTWQVSLAAHSGAAAALVLWNRVPVRNELPAFAAAGSGASGRTSHPRARFASHGGDRVGGTPSLSIAVVRQSNVN